MHRFKSLILLSIWASNMLLGISFTDQMTDEINREFKKRVKDKTYAGIIGLTAIDDSIVYFNTFGYQNLKTKDIPISFDRRFNSESKMSFVILFTLIQFYFLSLTKKIFN